MATNRARSKRQIQNVLEAFGLSLVLLASITAASLGNELLSFSKHVTSLGIGGHDAVGETCDAAAPNRYNGSICDSACDSSGVRGKCCSCRSRRECLCGLAYWHQPAENLVDHILPRSNLPFPLWKSLAEGSGIPLPLPLGTSVVFTELDRNVAVSDVRLGLGSNVPVSVDRVSVPTTEFHASSQIARVDLWAFPFLNVYGLVGHTTTSGNVQVTVDRFPLPFSPPVELNIPVELSGPTGGFGLTTALGSKRWFATLDVNKTWTDFSGLDSSLTALVITPRIGTPIDWPFFKGEMHIGAMWQDTAQTVQLTLDNPILGNGLQVEVDQIEPRPWNFLVGGLWAINERLQVLVEGGMGGRSYVITSITLRH